MKELLDLAIKTAIATGPEILKVYEAEMDVSLKDDRSPLTLADTASNQIINSYLEVSAIPIISEENKQLPYEGRNSWEMFWMVDPLDGTKEFIKKNGEFTVNIALCDKGKPVLGVIYVPVSRELYYADVAAGRAYKTVLNQDHSLATELYLEEDRIYPAQEKDSAIRVVGSRSHMNEDTLKYIETLKKDYKEVTIVSKGSSLKFCLVAEGKADVYPRFAPTMEWDTAAGHAICNAVGLKVVSRESQSELSYNKENLLNPYFLVGEA